MRPPARRRSTTPQRSDSSTRRPPRWPSDRRHPERRADRTCSMFGRAAFRVVADLTAIGLLAISLIGAMAPSPAAAAEGLRFVAPQTKHLSGTVDLEVEAPAGTTAV